MEPARGDSIRVFFVNCTKNQRVGKSIVVNVNQRDTISDLIHKLATVLNLKPDEVSFTLPGRTDLIKVTLKNAEEVEEEIQSLFNKSVGDLLVTESTSHVFQV